LGGLGPGGEEATKIILGKAEARPDLVCAHNGCKEAIRPGWSDQSAFGAEATTGDAGDRRPNFAVIQVELSKAGLRGGGVARTLRGRGHGLRIIGFLTASGLLAEKLALTEGFVGRLLRPRGFLRELCHGQRMGGDISRRIDAEKEIAGLHLSTFGVIDRLQDTRYARADFHLAHTFGLCRRNRRLGDVRQSHRKDRHRQWPGRRQGRLRATAEQAKHKDRTEKTLDRARFTYRHVCKSICPTMARKTKAEAALTRHRIVESARQVFSRDGVTNTSLDHVAKEAGVTRGAVYWHFRNKADLFMAVRQQTGTLLRFDDFKTGDALRRLETGLHEALRRLAEDKQAQETYEVMLWKCEYVGDFASVRKDLMSAGTLFLTEATELYKEAAREKLIAPELDPRLAACETFCFYAGMLKLWLADESGQTVRDDILKVITQHIDSRRLKRPARQKAV
jgi:TetR/AcrR family transcriptional regulator, acrAB operon repressor